MFVSSERLSARQVVIGEGCVDRRTKRTVAEFGPCCIEHPRRHCFRFVFAAALISCTIVSSAEMLSFGCVMR